MQRAIFGELAGGDDFYLDPQGPGFGQQYEKIALQDVQDIFPWTYARPPVNARWCPWCGPFTDKPEKYLYIDKNRIVFIEEQEG